MDECINNLITLLNPVEPHMSNMSMKHAILIETRPIYDHFNFIPFCSIKQSHQH